MTENLVKRGSTEYFTFTKVKNAFPIGSARDNEKRSVNVNAQGFNYYRYRYIDNKQTSIYLEDSSTIYGRSRSLFAQRRARLTMAGGRRAVPYLECPASISRLNLL
ncbi:hypothetical protein EVAR_23112_1 [Eumeta japonica]|uniref:Uncharacterized protein n=1 Tax=Eumeta variegata TaxID=151549 RepID=A0A4C1VLA4_EUMVA|nr:hypothetical protein EVAR_23112_1 [Eumeta japonica]